MLMMGCAFFMPNLVEHTLKVLMENTSTRSAPLIPLSRLNFCARGRMEVLLSLHLVIKLFTLFQSAAIRALLIFKAKVTRFGIFANHSSQPTVYGGG